MDTFRRVYTPLTEDQKILAEAIKISAEELLANFDNAVPTEERSERGRCMNIARTNLETAVMWAVKAVTTKQE